MWTTRAALLLCATDLDSEQLLETYDLNVLRKTTIHEFMLDK